MTFYAISEPQYETSNWYKSILNGLTGEIRSVSHMNQRLGEIARLGFKRCIIPKNGSEKLEIPSGLTVYRVRNLMEAIEMAL